MFLLFALRNYQHSHVSFIFFITERLTMPADSVIRIKPNHYIHVLDNNSNVTTVVVGPRTFTRRDHENIVLGPGILLFRSLHVEFHRANGNHSSKTVLQNCKSCSEGC